MIYRVLFNVVAAVIAVAALAVTVSAQDYHSYSNPSAVRVRHVDLDLKVLFDQKVLEGIATLNVERINADAPLILDTRELKIDKVETSSTGSNFSPTTFTVGDSDKFLGAPLTITLPAKATQVRITYVTSPGASGLQWLAPAPTAGKKQPFVFSSSDGHHRAVWG